jgi:hypothetical protein
MQLDVYGEVADAIVSMKRAGIHLDDRLLHRQPPLRIEPTCRSRIQQHVYQPF